MAAKLRHFSLSATPRTVLVVARSDVSYYLHLSRTSEIKKILGLLDNSYPSGRVRSMSTTTSPVVDE